MQFINFSVSETFTGEILVFGGISSLIFLSLVCSSNFLSHVFILRNPQGRNILDWLTDHRSFRILILFISHPIKPE